MDWTALATAFIALLVIVDPLPSIGVFVALSKGMSAKEKEKGANVAVFAAAAALFSFIIVGPLLMSVLGIAITDFKIAGGLVLLIIGITGVLGLQLPKDEKAAKDYTMSLVVIGVPLLTGPGALTTAILLVGIYGYEITITAAVGVLALSRFLLAYSDIVSKSLGPVGMEIFSRIMGLLLAAMAVGFIRAGLG